MPEYLYPDDRPAWTSCVSRPLQRLLVEHAPPPRRLFELGCGNGTTARTLAEMGYDVVGVDPSASGIAQARRHASANLRFETASTADDLRSRFGEFPVAVSVEVIEHCPSAREFMTAFRSVLAPGGLGLISTPYHGYLKNLLVIASGRFDRHFDPLWEGGHVRFFSIPKLRALFAEENLVPVGFHRVGRVPVIAKSVIAMVRKGAAASTLD
jgi:SAM-dependent methyltransferase